MISNIRGEEDRETPKIADFRQTSLTGVRSSGFNTGKSRTFGNKTVTIGKTEIKPGNFKFKVVDHEANHNNVLS